MVTSQQQLANFTKLARSIHGILCIDIHFQSIGEDKRQIKVNLHLHKCLTTRLTTPGLAYMVRCAGPGPGPGGPAQVWSGHNLAGPL